jgi:hypothetical protein
MKKNILFAILFTIPTILLSQSEINLGVGVGQQFGLPGIRAAYKWNWLEGSMNFGLLGGVEKKNIPKNYTFIETRNLCLGVGVSFHFKGIKKNPFSLSYNYGFVLYRNNDFINITDQVQFLHSVCLNNELLFNHTRWRFGYGIGYSKEFETIFNKVYPVLTLGCIFKIWQKKTDY